MLDSNDINHHRPLENPSHDEPTPPPPPPKVLTILSHVIEKLVARNDRLMAGLISQQENGGGISINDGGGGGGSVGGGGAWMGKSLDAFNGVRAPSISIPKYLERIYKYSNCSPSCFVVGYVYIDRLAHKYPDSLVVSLNVHRLLVTSVMVASKMLDDEHYNNAFFARVGGVSNAEFNRLELELLFLLDFGLVVSSRVFESYCHHLEKEMAMCNGTTNRIERPVVITSSSTDDVTDISLEDLQSSSATDLSFFSGKIPSSSTG